MSKKITEEVIKELINKQFELAWSNLKYEDIKWSKDWYYVNTITKEQENNYIARLKTFLLKYISKSRIDKEIDNFILWYWLRTKD